MNRIMRYLYLAIVIFMIRFILGLLGIFDMTLKGLLGSILTGLIFLFLMEIVDFVLNRREKEFEQKN